MSGISAQFAYPTQHPWTQTALVQALRNPDGEVRYLAAEQLAADHAVTAVPAMVDALTAEVVPGTKVNIAFALAQLGNKTGVTELRNTCQQMTVPTYLRVRASYYFARSEQRKLSNGYFKNSGIGIRVRS